MENFHISALRMPCFERLESIIMGESGINAYSLQPLAHYGKLFSLERCSETPGEYQAPGKKECRVLEKIEWDIPAAADSEWLLGAAEFISSFEDKSHAHLFGFYAIASVRGTGLASELLRASERELSSSFAIKSIDLSVSGENLRAVSFYKKNGYQICENFRDFYGAGNHRLIMKKSL